MLNYCCHAVLGFRTEFAREAVCSRAKGRGDRVLYTFTTPDLSVPHIQSTLTAGGFLSLFQSPQAASPFIFLNSLPFSGSHLLCLSRKCLLLCLNLKKKTQRFLPVLLESSAHPGLLLTVSCIFVSIAVTVCREKMGRCKISLQSKKWMSLQTILYSNPNWLLNFQLNFNFPWCLIFKINMQGFFTIGIIQPPIAAVARMFQAATQGRCERSQYLQIGYNNNLSCPSVQTI